MLFCFDQALGTCWVCEGSFDITIVLNVFDVLTGARAAP